MHTTLLTLHVVLAVFVIGPIVAAVNQAARALRAGDAGALGVIARTTTVYGWGALLVGVVGAGLVRPAYGNEWSDGWLIASVLLWLVGSALVIGLLGPLFRRAVTAAGAGGATAALAPRAAALSGVASLCYLVTAVLMVWQPGG